MNTKKILFICNTYMQLITAVQLRLKFLTEEDADILISDHSINSQMIAANLKKCNLFNRVRNIQTKYIMYEQGKLADFKDIIEFTFGFRSKIGDMLWQDATYDAIYYYNQDLITLCAYDLSVKNGKKPICNSFEEGILSYTAVHNSYASGRMKAIRILRKLLRKDTIFDITKDFYCFYPGIFQQNGWTCHGIPHLDRADKTLLETVNLIFDYHPERDSYSQKYIFFASSSDIDGNPVGETELVLRIADIVGKENLLVKMHPRDGRKVYEEHGIAVSRNSAIPWEVIQLNHDFSDHVFLTLSSGSVLNASSMLQDHIPTYFLFPCVRGRNEAFDRGYAKEIESTIKELQRTETLQGIRMLEKPSDLLEL